jgi:hypothetical protein
MSADPWVSEPIPFYATWDEAVRHDVFLLTEPTVEAAGGFDAVRRDPAHPLHSVYDDIDALERNIETIVSGSHQILGEDDFIVDPQRGVQLTMSGFEVVHDQVRTVLRSKPILHYRNDPTFSRDNPDELAPHHPFEIDPNPYLDRPAQALRNTILEEIAPDIAAAGGFPGVARNPNHRRHNSPEGLARIRRLYDQIVEHVEPQLTQSDYEESENYGWDLTPQAADKVLLMVNEVRLDFQIATAQAVGDVDEIRRHLTDLRLGMRPDEYVQTLAGSSANGTSMQQAARDELARRENLTEDEQGIESRIRTERQRQAMKVRQRSITTTELTQ